MTRPKPVLGRGLASLIPRPAPSSPPAPVAGADDGTSHDVIVNVDLDRIRMNPYQPRADFDPVALEDLKNSILEKGIIQPITVCRDGEGFQLVSGERRVRAAREAGMQQIPAYVIRLRSREEMLELALIENLQREDLNPIEVAISYKRLIEECSITQDQVSQKIGKDRSTVANFLRLLKLPEPIQTAVRKSQISNGHARALLGVDDAAVQMEIFTRIVEKGLSVRQVEQLVREVGKKKKKVVVRIPGTQNPETASIEDRLRQLLATKVEVRSLQDGKGQIVIEYYSEGDLDRLLELFDAIGQQPH